MGEPAQKLTPEEVAMLGKLLKKLLSSAPDETLPDHEPKPVNRAAAPTPESYDRVRKRMKRHGT